MLKSAPLPAGSTIRKGAHVAHRCCGGCDVLRGRDLRIALEKSRRILRYRIPRRVKVLKW